MASARLLSGATQRSMRPTGSVHGLDRGATRSTKGLVAATDDGAPERRKEEEEEEEKAQNWVFPSLGTLNSLMAGLCARRALQLYAGMVRRGSAPNQLTMAAMAKALAAAGEPPATRLRLFRCMGRLHGLAPTAVVYNAVIHQLCRRGDVPAAERAWAEMAGRGVEPNAATFTILLDAHAKNGDMGRARGVFAEMRARGSAPDAVAYTALLDVYLKRGDLAAARRVRREMREAGVAETAATLCAVVDGLCRLGKTRQAVEMVLGEEGHAATRQALYAALIRGLYADAQDFKAGRVFLRMRGAGLVPDAATYALLRRGQCRLGRPINASALLADMLKNGTTEHNARNGTGRWD